MAEKTRVLILCTANSARSQMAEGLLRELGGESVEVYSAGTHPSTVNPYAIRAMQDRHIDISQHTSDGIDSYLGENFDYVITVCDNAAETCPTFPGDVQRIHWSFDDPAAVDGDDEAILQMFIATRNGLEAQLRNFLREVNA